jgi:Spy/CpxP family protein refolding chaperone
MKSAIALAGLLVVCSLNASAQNKPAASATLPSADSRAGAPWIDPAKEKDIRRLLEMTGAKQRMSLTIDGMEKSVRPLMERSLPPGDYRDKLIEAFFARFHSKLDLEQQLDLAVPLYDKAFSDEEIKGLIAFYETPLGRKLASTSPQLTSEMMEAGRKWGEQLGRTTMAEVLNEHPEFEQAIEDAAKNQSRLNP